MDWYPWGEEAFEKAGRENKAIFLSIGYSTCHWCHVMEKESFEDIEIAELMNNAFVSIKVDREERPDIDNIYMMICQMMTGKGGWPLTIIMTPDKKPFFAGTYIPKETMFEQIGMMEFIPRVKEFWRSNRDKVICSAEEITNAINHTSTLLPARTPDIHILKTAYEQLSRSFDQQYGGFGNPPKFPTPHQLTFLLRYWRRTRNENSLLMVEKTLQSMRYGGIYDHVGFGFHRYSTDRRWLVPHFEKMLYDQALIAIAYIEAYQATGKEEYGETAKEIFAYVLRDMTDPNGGYYSAEDADSEGEEGRFYLWTEEDIRHALSKEDAEIILKVFNIGIDESTGKHREDNTLYINKPFTEILSELNMSEKDIKSRLETIRERLFSCREKRVRPHKDDKILTDWNGLMIAALAKAAQALDEPVYTDSARLAADFILLKMCDAEGRLYHRYREGESAIPAFIDDYAFLIWGLIELYEATFDVHYLKKATDLNQVMIQHFWDKERSGFFFTPDDGEKLIARKKEIYDGAVPSGNSVAMLNLLRLGRITGNTEFEKMAEMIWQTFSHTVMEMPWAYTQLMSALDFAIGQSYEVIIVGNSQAEDTKSMLNTLRKKFIPNKVVLFRPEKENPEITNIASFTRDLSAIKNKATAYICINNYCQLPTTDIKKMLRLLDTREECCQPEIR